MDRGVAGFVGADRLSDLAHPRSCGASPRHFSYGFPAYCRSLPPQLPLWFSPVLYQSRTLRYCCDRSMNYLYHLSQAVARLGAHGGPKREAAIRTAGVPDSSVRRQRLSALRGPLALMTDAVSAIFVRLLGLLHRLFQASVSFSRSTSCRRMPARGLSPGSGKV